MHISIKKGILEACTNIILTIKLAASEKISLHIFITMLFSNVFAVCRKRFADKVIKSAAHDSIKSDALNEFAFYMFDYNVDSSVLLAKQAEEKAVKAGSIRQLARAFKNTSLVTT
jgi:hypothetical protein